jgi:hypothetical protein
LQIKFLRSMLKQLPAKTKLTIRLQVFHILLSLQMTSNMVLVIKYHFGFLAFYIDFLIFITRFFTFVPR